MMLELLGKIPFLSHLFKCLLIHGALKKHNNNHVTEIKKQELKKNF